MSRPADSRDLFPSLDPSGDFARDEGRIGYKVLADKDMDGRSISAAAERAVRLSMVATGRFDIDPGRATEALVEELVSDLPDINGESVE